MKLHIYLLVLLLFSGVSLYAQSSFADLEKTISDIEESIYDEELYDYKKTVEQLQVILDSAYTDLHPRARTLLYLTAEIGRAKKPVDNPENETNAKHKIHYGHLTKPAIASLAAGSAGYLGFFSLQLWSDSLYYHRYLELGAGQEREAADLMRLWKGLDTGAFISLGIGTAGFMLTPLFLNMGTPAVKRLDDESFISLTGVTTAEKRAILEAQRQKYLEEYHRALRRRPKQKALAFTSLGLSFASGITSAFCSSIAGDARLDYGKALNETDSARALSKAQLYDMLTLISAGTSALFATSSAVLFKTMDRPEDIAEKIIAIDFRLQNIIGY